MRMYQPTYLLSPWSTVILGPPIHCVHCQGQELYVEEGEIMALPLTHEHVPTNIEKVCPWQMCVCAFGKEGMVVSSVFLRLVLSACIETYCSQHVRKLGIPLIQPSPVDLSGLCFF